MSYVVIIETGTWPALPIGPFDDRAAAQTEAARWEPKTRPVICYLWDGDDLRRDLQAVKDEAR